ncbi:MAG: hypothetical protein E7660_01240 [Ruminococcaceae bacterium]|nr:hypothetical protein [Oscillospiraceae bacterium]
MKKRRVSVFYIIYFALIALFLVGLFFGLSAFRDYLAGYESSRPVHTMEKVAEEYFLAEDKVPLLEISGYEVSKYCTKDAVISYLETAIDKETFQFFNTGGNDKEIFYSVVSKELKIANVTLVLSDEPDAEGFPVYSLGDIELTIGGSGGLSIEAPLGYSVFVNGEPLGEDLLSGEPTLTESCNHMYGDAEGISLVKYKLEGIFGEPVVTATDKYGEAVEGITADESGVFYTVPVNYKEIPEDLKNRILKASELYAAYMQKDATFGAVAAYVDRTSELYTNLRNTAVKWANPHNGYTIVEPEVIEYYSYDADGTVVSCRVKFVHLLHGYGGNNYEESFDMTFYLRSVGGRYMIYASHVN